MEDNNLKNQFSADLLGAVSKVLGEAEQIDELKASTVRSLLDKRKNAMGPETKEKKEKHRKSGWLAFAKLHKQPHAKVHATEEVSLDEKHGGADYAIYHKSYTDAVDHALSHHGKSGLSVSDDDRFHHIGLMSKKPSEGNTTTLNLPAKDHATGKDHTIHMQVYNRGGSHPYELNTYSSKNSTQRQIDRVAAKRKKALGEETEYEKNKKETQKTFPNVKYFTKKGHPDWAKHDSEKNVKEDTIEEKLIGNQAKLDHDGDGKLEKSDFKKLRNKKIAAKMKDKDCACDDDDKMDEAVYNGHRPTGLPPGQGLPKAQQDALTAKLRDFDAKMDAAKKKFATKEEVELDETSEKKLRGYLDGHQERMPAIKTKMNKAGAIADEGKDASERKKASKEWDALYKTKQKREKGYNMAKKQLVKKVYGVKEEVELDEAKFKAPHDDSFVQSIHPRTGPEAKFYHKNGMIWRPGSGNGETWRVRFGDREKGDLDKSSNESPKRYRSMEKAKAALIAGKPVKEETALDEGTVSHTDLAQAAHKSYVQATRLGNGTMAAHYLKQHKKHKDLAAKEKAVKEEVEPTTRKRGRPAKPGSAAYIAQQKAKEAGEAEGPEPDEHIMNQVRKAADSGMMPHKIKYADGSTHALHRVHARAVIAKYNRLKPFAKEDMQAEIAKSHEHMMKHAKD